MLRLFIACTFIYFAIWVKNLTLLLAAERAYAEKGLYLVPPIHDDYMPRPERDW